MGEYKFIVRVTCKTYNHAAFIKDAMDGFCMQETSFPFLCIIVDDASMDGEQEVIQNYLNEHFALTGDDDFRRDETDDYIRIYARHKTNTNCYFLVIFLKYNHYSIKKSKAPYIKEWKDTKYIAMCEGDDYWIDSRKLQRQYDFMESHPDFSLCCHNAIVSFENKDKRAFNSVGEDREIKMEELLDKWLCPTASLFIRRSVLPTFPVNGNIIGGDWRIILHCAASGKVWSINDVMACYRRTNIRTSMSNTFAHKSDELFLRKVPILEGLDKYTEGRYHDLIRKHIRFYTVFGKLIQFKKQHGMLATVLLRPFSIIEIVWKRNIRPRLVKNAPTFSA